jgi:hypothetical protein
VTIQVVGPSQTVISSNFAIAPSSPEGTPGVYTYALKGLTFDSLLIENTGGSTVSVTVTNAVINSAGAAAVYLETPIATTLTLDGVDITAGTSQPAIYLQGDEITLTVQNCYIHGSQSGIAISLGATSDGDVFSFLNNTIINNGSGLNLPAVGTSSLGKIYNNLLIDNTTGILEYAPADVGYNALYGNTTNYSGSATDGPGYVKTDPLLDTSTSPPGLLPGSPCRGTGDAMVAPSTDFYGRPRGSSVDIGAVQSSP